MDSPQLHGKSTDLRRESRHRSCGCPQRRPTYAIPTASILPLGNLANLLGNPGTVPALVLTPGGAGFSPTWCVGNTDILPSHRALNVVHSRHSEARRALESPSGISSTHPGGKAPHKTDQ